MSRGRGDEARAPQREMLEQVAHKAERRLKAEAERRRSIWFGLGMFGLVGWAVAIPTLLGLGLGLWLDARWPEGRISWTLTLLGLGVALGCWNAWYWVQRETRPE
jgi:ATP synthase protein I